MCEENNFIMYMCQDLLFYYNTLYNLFKMSADEGNLAGVYHRDPQRQTSTLTPRVNFRVILLKLKYFIINIRTGR